MPIFNYIEKCYQKFVAYAIDTDYLFDIFSENITRKQINDHKLLTCLQKEYIFKYLFDNYSLSNIRSLRVNFYNDKSSIESVQNYIETRWKTDLLNQTGEI